MPEGVWKKTNLGEEMTWGNYRFNMRKENISGWEIEALGIENEDVAILVSNLNLVFTRAEAVRVVQAIINLDKRR